METNLSSYRVIYPNTLYKSTTYIQGPAKEAKNTINNKKLVSFITLPANSSASSSDIFYYNNDSSWS